jgi:hypothetical protein
MERRVRYLPRERRMEERVREPVYTQMERRVRYLPRERRMEEREARVRVREPVYTQMERRMREVEMRRWLASRNRYTLKRLSFNPSQKVKLNIIDCDFYHVI